MLVRPWHTSSVQARSRIAAASRRWGLVGTLAAVGLWTSCRATDDTVGFNYPAVTAGAGQGGATAQGGDHSSAGAASGGEAGVPNIERTYPNLFAELLGKTEDEITGKLDADFEQLFYGDPTSESIYVSVGADQAYVWDPRQMDIRSDGFANALLVSVELDRREEFDKLWRFADAHIVAKTGPLRDYLRSPCAISGDSCDDNVLSEPHFAATTALWLAHGRWGSGGSLSYLEQAERLMNAVFRREPGASTALGELSGMVDAARTLPLDSPYTSNALQARSASMTAAYFELWAEKSGDARALQLAQNARQFLKTVANSSTGLMPDQASLDGMFDPSGDVFSANSYPVPVAISLDAVWFGASSWHVAEANLLQDFFRAPLAAKSYAATYVVSGEPGAPLRDLLSLQAPLSACAVASTSPARLEFVQAAWDARLNTGTSRKFGNLLYLLSSLLLSGRMRVY